ncbi:TetR family transcriptional regulator [Enterovibrio norvegicus]|nr:TetR family transcriptional regulator [Enterovibrio norvegicus]OEF56780.1 TetR family transcriptional regulator [Enterovibrio norvegicus]OEF63818.1 TetR family transcriptional regulator [Enterovibrio norvegicus]PMH67254.1 TetR family transcriptional regulator [Enterovibrio norvegicus]PMI31808.1 TetR family transcriptional regulator [Enterovibrio norvegicus]
MLKAHNILFVINRLANNFAMPIYEPCVLTVIDSVDQNHLSIQRAVFYLF